MNVPNELKTMEAVQRMKNLGLMRESIQAFKKKNEIWLSEMTGGLYEISSDKELNEIIRNIEQEYNLLVYHVIHTYTNFGELYNLLYVSDYMEEWEMDNEDISDGYVMAYVHNKSCEWCSEFGTISVRPTFGGLVRIG